MTRREPIFRALAKRLEAVPGVATFGRRLRHWSDVPQGEQPALFMSCGSQSVEAKGFGLAALSLNATLYLYCQNHDPGLQNDLLDAVEEALAPEPGEAVLTLGGLVARCWIDGDIETDEGLLGEQAVAIVPVSILIP